MSGGVKSRAAAPLVREGPVRVIKNLSPGAAFASVCGIVIGAMMLLGAAGQILRAYFELDDFQSAFGADPDLVGWRWVSVTFMAGWGLTALLGGINGAAGKPDAARTIKVAAGAALVWWALEAFFWGSWCFLRVIEGPMGGRTGSGSTIAYEHVPPVLAWLIVSALCIFSWAVVTFVLLRERKGKPLAEEASASNDEFPRPVISQPPFIDYGSQTEGRRPSFQAPSALVRLLFVLAIAQGALSLCMDRETLIDVAAHFPGRALFSSPLLVHIATDRDSWLALTEIVDGGAALIVLLGGAWGLARAPTGRNVLFTGLGIMLIVAIVHLRLQLAGVIDQILHPYYYPNRSWSLIVPPIGLFIRLQFFTIICFVALARKLPSDAGREIGRRAKPE